MDFEDFERREEVLVSRISGGFKLLGLTFLTDVLWLLYLRWFSQALLLPN